MKQKKEIELEGLKKRLEVIISLKERAKYFPGELIWELMEVEYKIGKLVKELSYHD